MPTYKVGNEPLKPRKSLREVLCEHCGKTMGKALFTRPFAGLTAEKAIELWPYLKVDIKLHETACSGQESSDKNVKSQGGLIPDSRIT